jgi:hypothetical protein
MWRSLVHDTTDSSRPCRRYELNLLPYESRLPPTTPQGDALPARPVFPEIKAWTSVDEQWRKLQLVVDTAREVCGG